MELVPFPVHCYINICNKTGMCYFPVHNNLDTIFPERMINHHLSKVTYKFFFTLHPSTTVPITKAVVNIIMYVKILCYHHFVQPLHFIQYNCFTIRSEQTYLSISDKTNKKRSEERRVGKECRYRWSAYR